MSDQRDRHDEIEVVSTTRRGITRRRFLVTSAKAGALAATGLGLACGKATPVMPDVVSAHGPNVVENTHAVIEALGGIEKFVRPGQVVNILPNAQGSNPGTSTNVDLVRTVVELCREAGAEKVCWLTWISGRYWEMSRIGDFVEASGAELVQVDAKDESQWRTVEVTNGVALKKVRVFEALWDGDVFINMPIFKDHIGSRFTGSLKNYMGASHPEDNQAFHPTFEGDDVIHMEQCIADLNTIVRAPDLIVADAMTVLTSNGPFGPGDIAEPKRVVAGVDRVACDAYGAGILGLNGPDVTMIRKSHEHGLGKIDLATVNVKELEAV
jgi:uncharacterized protein (DUF362 family)